MIPSTSSIASAKQELSSFSRPTAGSKADASVNRAAHSTLTSCLLDRSTGCIAMEFVLGVILIVICAVVLPQLPHIIHDEIKRFDIVTSQNSGGYGDFLNMSGKVPIKFSNYFFNISNLEAVLERGEMPHLTQMGPYTYRTVVWKPEAYVSWLPNGTVRYVEGQTFEFLRNESSGDESDRFFTVNISLIGVVKKAQSLSNNSIDNGLVWTILEELFGLGKLTPRDLFASIRVGDLLNNLTDPLLVKLNKLDPAVKSWIAIQPQRPDPRPEEFLTEAYTGGPRSSSIAAPPLEPMRYMSVTMWHRHQPLSFWATEYANMINGTDGTVYPPGLTPQHELYVFIASLYRSFRLVCTSDDVIVHDARVLRYRLDPLLLQSSEVYPPNAGFNIDHAGFLPTPPSLSLPYFFSQPFFLAANQSGINVKLPGPADPTIHETFIDIEPNTGVLFNVSKRVQVNIAIGETVLGGRVIPFTRGIAPAILPVAWFDQHMELPESLAQEVIHKVLDVDHSVRATLVVLGAGGALLVVIACASVYRKWLR